MAAARQAKEQDAEREREKEREWERGQERERLRQEREHLTEKGEVVVIEEGPVPVLLVPSPERDSAARQAKLRAFLEEEEAREREKKKRKKEEKEKKDKTYKKEKKVQKFGLANSLVGLGSFWPFGPFLGASASAHMLLSIADSPDSERVVGNIIVSVRVT